MTDEARRAYYLTNPELARLRTWGFEVKLAFGKMPYLVGSVLRRRDFRDVDVRICTDAPPTGIDLHYLNLAVSEWGRAWTGLPVEFQAQPAEEFHTYDHEPRQALGISSLARQEARRKP